jgi:hypothetical protein
MIKRDVKLAEQRRSACRRTLQRFNQEYNTSIHFLTNSDRRSDNSSLLQTFSEVCR